MVGWIEILAERDLHARDTFDLQGLVDRALRRVTDGDPVWSKQHDAVAIGTMAVVENSFAMGVEMDESLHPAGAIEVGPLVGEAKVDLDDAAADGFDVNHAGVASEVLARPRGVPCLDISSRRCHLGRLRQLHDSTT